MSEFPLPHAVPETVGLATTGLARLGRVLRGEIERGRVPGAVALVARRGEIAYFESFGQRDPVSGAPMARDSIFRIYSMTKPIVSVAAMMLWEEGRFLLSDPIGKFLPELGTRERRGGAGRHRTCAGRKTHHHSRPAAAYVGFDLRISRQRTRAQALHGCTDLQPRSKQRRIK